MVAGSKGEGAGSKGWEQGARGMEQGAETPLSPPPPLTLSCGDIASAIKAPALAMIIRELFVYIGAFCLKM